MGQSLSAVLMWSCRHITRSDTTESYEVSSLIFYSSHHTSFPQGLPQFTISISVYKTPHFLTKMSACFLKLNLVRQSLILKGWSTCSFFAWLLTLPNLQHPSGLPSASGWAGHASASMNIQSSSAPWREHAELLRSAYLFFIPLCGLYSRSRPEAYWAPSVLGFRDAWTVLGFPYHTSLLPIMKVRIMRSHSQCQSWHLGRSN